MVTLFGTSGFSQGTPLANLWPDDNSTDQLQPSVVVPGQTFTITFAGTNPSNTVQRLRNRGIISINLGPLGTGNWQQQTLQIGTDPGIVLNGNTISVNFPNDNFAEDTYYFITVSGDAIQFMNGSYFSGLGYSLNPDFDVAADWGFKVKDVHKPQMVTCVSPTIHNGERNVGVNENIVYICFNEPVNWKPGFNPATMLHNGDIAFYHATNPELDNGDPYGEFGGDVLYARPARVSVAISPPSPSPAVTNPFDYFEGFNELEVWVKDGPGDKESSKLKYDAIGSNVWPKDADIYMRFLAGLLEDKDGNTWDGVSGSPFDIYTVSADRFWFTTRNNAEITSDIWPVENNSQVAGHSPLLWNNDDFNIRIDEDNLTWIAGPNMNNPIASTNATGLIEFEVNGVPALFTIPSGTDGVWES